MHSPLGNPLLQYNVSIGVQNKRRSEDSVPWSAISNHIIAGDSVVYCIVTPRSQVGGRSTQGIAFAIVGGALAEDFEGVARL